MSNILNASSIFDEQSGGSRTRLTTGLHEALDVKTFLMPNYFDIVVEKDGLTQNKRLFIPDYNKFPARIREDESQDQANFRDLKERLAHITLVMKIFMDEDQFKNFQAPVVENDHAQTFKLFAEKAHNELQTLLPTKQVNVKLIPTKDGLYSEFPFFATSTWIEEHVPGQPSTLKYSKYELKRIQESMAGPKSDDTVLTNESSPNTGFNMFNNGE